MIPWNSNVFNFHHDLGVNKELGIDRDTYGTMIEVRLFGRVYAEPYGWYDERAKERGELSQVLSVTLAPQDQRGTIFSGAYYIDPRVSSDQLLMYVPSLRRVRKLTSTDTQDPSFGGDAPYDDMYGLSQRLSPDRFPYEYEIIEEREYLIPVSDGTEFFSLPGLELRNIKMERRPVYVVQMTQKDPNYVYSKRILYVDQELFLLYFAENYDQKGRLYRTACIMYKFYPEMGVGIRKTTIYKDHIALHSTVGHHYNVPAFYERKDVSLRNIMKKAK